MFNALSPDARFRGVTLDLGHKLNRDRFVTFGRGDLKADFDFDKALVTFRDSFGRLPRDPYSGDVIRERRLSRFLYLPWCDGIVPLPDSVYQQDASLNPTEAGVARRFTPLEESTVSNPLLGALIRADYGIVPWAAGAHGTPFVVNIHQIRYVATPTVPASSSPPTLHQDGEHITFIHLLNLDVAESRGGENVIVAVEDDRPLVRAALQSPLDSLGFEDARVRHAVRELHVAPGFERAHRDVILVDFTPLVADTNDYS